MIGVGSVTGTWFYLANSNNNIKLCEKIKCFVEMPICNWKEKGNKCNCAEGSAVGSSRNILFIFSQKFVKILG